MPCYHLARYFRRNKSFFSPHSYERHMQLLPLIVPFKQDANIDSLLKYQSWPEETLCLSPLSVSIKDSYIFFLRTCLVLSFSNCAKVLSPLHIFWDLLWSNIFCSPTAPAEGVEPAEPSTPMKHIFMPPLSHFFQWKSTVSSNSLTRYTIPILPQLIEEKHVVNRLP